MFSTYLIVFNPLDSDFYIHNLYKYNSHKKSRNVNTIVILSIIQYILVYAQNYFLSHKEVRFKRRLKIYLIYKHIIIYVKISKSFLINLFSIIYRNVILRYCIVQRVNI